MRYYERVLFLDIDGVLNSSRRMGVRAECHSCNGLCWFDPKAVARVNAVTARTGAGIVVSSAWRVGKRVVDLREILGLHGVEGTVIDKTPSPFVVCRVGDQNVFSKRGQEINAWFELARQPPVAFAIVDDDTNMAPLEHRHVVTQWDTGLLDEHVEQLVALLETPVAESIG